MDDPSEPDPGPDCFSQLTLPKLDGRPCSDVPVPHHRRVILVLPRQSCCPIPSYA